MSVLQAIELAEEWVAKAENGDKTITVRKDKRSYSQGRLILVAPTKKWCKQVTCTSVVHIPLGDISDDIAQADGFANTQELKNKLSEYYGHVPDTTIMTIVTWE